MYFKETGHGDEKWVDRLGRGSNEEGNDSSGSKKAVKFLHWLSD
jgi:hypothetical protein